MIKEQHLRIAQLERTIMQMRQRREWGDSSSSSLLTGGEDDETGMDDVADEAAAVSKTSSQTSSTSIQCNNSHFPYVHVSIFWSCDKKSVFDVVEVNRSINVLQSAGTSEELFLSLDRSIFILALYYVHSKRITLLTVVLNVLKE